MFKAFKYLLLAKLYKRAKKSFVILFASLVSLFIVSLIINDLLSIATGMSVYILLTVKWVIILGLLALIFYSFIKILNIALTPFEDVTIPVFKKEEKHDDKKEYILSKEKLHTKSDLIMQKYMKDLTCN